MVFLGTLNSSVSICKFNSQGQFIANQSGCYNLHPVFDWIKRCIYSIFLVFMIAFMPLFLQGILTPLILGICIFTDIHCRTYWAWSWSCNHPSYENFTSLSPVFEVFSTQIYCHSILSNLNYGGARYIATGRGFATSRVSFSTLYSRFAGPSIYFGMRTLIMLLYVTLSLWIPHLIYFWITTLALCLLPFIFNPHQFSFADFVIDYRYEKVDSVQLFSVILIYFTGNTSGGCLVVMLSHIRLS